ncbi:MAG: hypothetical protein AABW72_02405 [archaeon]
MPSIRRHSTSKRVKAWRAKKGIARKARFPKGKRKGEIIYKNPNAVPVPREIVERGQRKPFTLENVEWIRVWDNVFLDPFGRKQAKGGYGAIFWGKIKFKGKASSERIVVKQFHKFVSGTYSQQMPEIIARLKRSGVPHPKMAYFEISKGHEEIERYIVMEPFIKVGESEDLSGQRKKVVYTKFLPSDEFIHDMDLRDEKEQAVFRETAEQLVLLTKAKLELGGTYDYRRWGRVDAFNGITLQDRSVKVFVQDLDILYPSQENDAKIWENSAHNLRVAVCAKYSLNHRFATDILNKVARRHKLPMI